MTNLAGLGQIHQQKISLSNNIDTHTHTHTHTRTDYSVCMINHHARLSRGFKTNLAKRNFKMFNF